jgi:phage shock protein E
MPRFNQQPVDVVLDVRTKLEYWLGHLPGATQIAVDDLEAKLPTHPEIAKDARILVYCQSGARSAAAKQILGRLGYRRVVDGGGIATAHAGFEA